MSHVETYTVFGPAGAMLVPVEPTTKRKGKGPKVTTLPAPEAPAMPKAGKGEPKAPKAKPEGKTKAEGKAEGAPVLNEEQQAATKAVIDAANAVEGGARSAAVAISAAHALGLPRAWGLSLSAWVVNTLTGAGLAKATVYYLKDIGTATAAIGTERAGRFPMEGLRAIASAAKGDAKTIREMADVAQGEDEEAKPTLDACRKAAKGASDEPMDEGTMIDRLMKMAMKMTKDDAVAAENLLGKAASKTRAMEKARQIAEAMAEAKMKATKNAGTA